MYRRAVTNSYSNFGTAKASSERPAPTNAAKRTHGGNLAKETANVESGHAIDSERATGGPLRFEPRRPREVAANQAGTKSSVSCSLVEKAWTRRAGAATGDGWPLTRGTGSASP